MLASTRIEESEAHPSFGERPPAANRWPSSYLPLCKLIIPANLDLDEIRRLAPELHGIHDDYLRWPFHHLMTKKNAYRHSHTKYQPMHSEKCWQAMLPLGRNNICGKIKSAYLKLGILQCNGHYIKGTKSMCWRIAAKYRGRTQQVIVTNKALEAKLRLRKIQIHNQAVPESQLSKLDKHLLSWLRRLEIDTEAAYAAIDALPAKQPSRARKIQRNARTTHRNTRRHKARLMRQQLDHHQNRLDLCRVTVDEIKQKDVYYLICKQSRRHTPLTRLVTEARETLRYQGEKLVSIDIANSQLIFFSLLYLESQFKKIIQSDDRYSEMHIPSPSSHQELLPADGQKFTGFVMDGMIYDYLLDLHNDCVGAEQKLKGRREFKRRFFADVLYGDTSQDYVALSPLALIFQVEFPSVWQFIIESKTELGWDKQAFKRLSLLMQRHEAKFMFGQVCTRLMEHHSEMPVWTIHDSILTTLEHVKLVVRIMREEFDRLKIAPQLRVDDDIYRPDRRDTKMPFGATETREEAMNPVDRTGQPFDLLV